MGAPTNIYVDPSIAGNSGAGTIGDPYGDLQYALDTATRDATNGDQFNVKAGTDELIAASISLATYGTPTFDAPLIFRGYTSAANDGGVGGVDMQGNNASILAATTAVHWIDMHLHGTGTAVVLNLGLYGSCQQCELSDSTGGGIVFGGLMAFAVANNLHNLSGIGIDSNAQESIHILNNYLKNETNAFSTAIVAYEGSNIRGNILSLDGSSNGIGFNAGSSQAAQIAGNSILSASGTGVGINVTATYKINALVINNLVEGFSGVGGTGIRLASGSRTVGLYGHNAVFNCTTEYDTDDDVVHDLGDNESLSVTPFDKSGADTFANRFTYFAPVDTGNVHGGAYVG